MCSSYANRQQASLHFVFLACLIVTLMVKIMVAIKAALQSMLDYSMIKRMLYLLTISAVDIE